MILTYKVKHDRDFRAELVKARQVAEYAIHNRDKLSTKYVAHLGLKSAIANQILRKYGRDRTCLKVTRVKLAVPGQGIKVDELSMYVPCLELVLQIPRLVEKVNQIELDKEFVYISCTVPEIEQYETEEWIGVDRNATSHLAVTANPSTGKVNKYGKQSSHTHNKYRQLRKRYQKKVVFSKANQCRKRESRIVRDINHKISRKIVNDAQRLRVGIKLENLKGIRNTRKQAKSFRGTLHSWPFYQLQTFIEYKAKLLGIPVTYVDPAYTSQRCSRCRLIGKRVNKEFRCASCRTVEHADVNAAFNIASASIVRFAGERVSANGSTDTPKLAMGVKASNQRTLAALA